MAVKDFTRLPNRLWRVIPLTLCTFALSSMLLVSPSPAETHVSLPGESCRVPPLDAWKDKPEEWVWTQVCEGKVANFNSRYGVTLDPKSPNGWTRDRELNSTFLETILLQAPFRSALTRKGVRIIGTWFREPVDLAHARLEHQLQLEVSRFESPVSLERLKSDETISFDGSVFAGPLNIGSMVVDGDLQLRKLVALSDVYARKAEIKGEINLYGSTITGTLNMDSMRLGKDLNMYASMFNEVILNSAEIGGLIDMHSSKFAGKLRMDKVKIRSSLFMQKFEDKLAEFREVTLAGARIGGQVSMIGSTFTGKLNMEGIEVGGLLLMGDGAEFEKVRLRGAKIGGQLAMIGSKFTGKLNMNSMEVGGDLFMHGGAEFGDVDLRGAKIGDQFAMAGSKFTGKLDMNSMEVGSSLLMRGGAEFSDVVLRNAKIGVQLSMIGSKFTGKLDMNSMEVGGSLFMRGGEFAEPVPLIFTKIGSNLDLSGAKLASLDLTGTRIEGELRLGSGEHSATEWSVGSELTLRNTVVGALQDRRDAWPEGLELEGFTYGRLGGFAGGGATEMASREAQWFIEWLGIDETYSPQPYEQLASVLRKAGLEGKADEVLYESQHRQRQVSWDQRLWGTWLWSATNQVFIGYGYRIYYAIWWGLGLTGLGTLFLFVSGDFRQSKLTKEVITGWRTLWDEVKRTVGKDLYFSFDMILPLIELRKSHYETSIELRPVVEAYFIVHKLMGYVLVSFLIAGLSGLTK